MIFSKSLPFLKHFCLNLTQKPLRQHNIYKDAIALFHACCVGPQFLINTILWDTVIGLVYHSLYKLHTMEESVLPAVSLTVELIDLISFCPWDVSFKSPHIRHYSQQTWVYVKKMWAATTLVALTTGSSVKISVCTQELGFHWYWWELIKPTTTLESFDTGLKLNEINQ